MLVCKIQEIKLCDHLHLLDGQTLVKTHTHKKNFSIKRMRGLRIRIKNHSKHYPKLQATNMRFWSHLWFGRTKLGHGYFSAGAEKFLIGGVQLCLWEMKETRGRKMGCVSFGIFWVPATYSGNSVCPPRTPGQLCAL